jgi:hypothetical protein
MLLAMSPVHLRKAVGVTSVALGLALWAATAFPLARETVRLGDRSWYFLFLAAIPAMSLPGILLMVFGYRLFRELSETSLKWVLGTCAVVSTIWIAAESTPMFPALLPERLLRDAGLTLGLLVGIPGYAFGMRALLSLIGGPRRGALDFVGSRIVFVLAWQLFFILSHLFDAFTPLKPGDKYLHQEPWDFVGFLVPLGVAYGFYKAANHWLDRREKDRAMEMSLASASGAGTDKLA